MNAHQEQDLFFDFCINALNDAWRILKTIKSEPKNNLVAPALRFALITYAKPYKRSRGIEISRHVLDPAFIPSQHLELHTRLITARDQIHAHMDLGPYEPRYYSGDPGQGIANGYATNYINEIEELRNIDSIIDLIEKTLDQMYLYEKEHRETPAT